MDVTTTIHPCFVPFRTQSDVPTRLEDDRTNVSRFVGSVASCQPPIGSMEQRRCAVSRRGDEWMSPAPARHRHRAPFRRKIKRVDVTAAPRRSQACHGGLELEARAIVQSPQSSAHSKAFSCKRHTRRHTDCQRHLSMNSRSEYLSFGPYLLSSISPTASCIRWYDAINSHRSPDRTFNRKNRRFPRCDGIRSSLGFLSLQCHIHAYTKS